ncbi:MAG: DUF5106 domain-containing protein [Culturomica sp.]|jgi:thiol-disulfide isomerase/thioredoxin|nr:DUF5106 domain-containing protein [Culturomica sp.]
MFRIYLITLLCIVGTFKTFAQGYDIKITVGKMPNKDVILARYYEDKILSVDTARLNAKGYGEFKNSYKKLARGHYILVFSPSNIFELIIGGNQKFNITSDTVDVIDNIRFENSPENQAFLDFQKFMVSLNKKGNEINEKYKKDPNKNNKDVQEAYQGLYKDLEKENRDHIKNLTVKFPKSAVATFANLTLSPDVPDFSKTVAANTPDRDMEIRKKSFYYMKNHYWDYTDFADTTILSTKIFKQKLDNYFENMVVVNPDSLYHACDDLLTKARNANKTVFRYLMNYCLVYTFDNKIMGMDEAFVKLGEKYYIGGIVNWLNKDQMKKITDEVYKRQYNLIGHKALDLQLPTIDGQVASIYTTKAPFMLLLFWEPNCGHCKKIVPQVKEKIDNRFAPYGLKVFAVNIDKESEKPRWVEFVEKHELFDFVNVWDPKKQSNYWTIYNVFSTPVMYILDKDKKIIAKNLSVEQMVDLLTNEYKKQGIEVK